jgi:conjugative transposon TraM protein
MKSSTQSPKFLRQRKFLMVLPLLAFPFLTMAFWALGGGKNPEGEEPVNQQQGLNLELPGVGTQKKEELDKLAIYEKVLSDSLKIREAKKNDPYANMSFGALVTEEKEMDKTTLADNGIDKMYQTANAKTKGLNVSPSHPAGYTDQNEAKVYQKLDQLNRVLNQTASPKVAAGSLEKNILSNQSPDAGSTNTDIERLENVVQQINENPVADKEVQQYEALLNKIIQIQNPNNSADSIRLQSFKNKRQVYPVAATPVNNDKDELFDRQVDSSSNKYFSKNETIQYFQNAFYSVDELPFEATPNANVVEAIIYQDQQLVSGATVKLQSATDLFIQGIKIPAGAFLYGVATLTNDRLQVSIPSIRYQNAIYPVDLQVYDLDGLPGIYIPGSIIRESAKQSADDAIQQTDIGIYNPSLGAQAASAGLQAAKTLIGKKIKLIKVTLKAGYRVLLKNTQSQE